MIGEKKPPCQSAREQNLTMQDGSMNASDVINNSQVMMGSDEQASLQRLGSGNMHRNHGQQRPAGLLTMNEHQMLHYRNELIN